MVPTIDVKEVDSTGAGDIFHGAFAYCLLKKYDIEKSIKKQIVVEGAKIVGLTNDNLCFNNLGYFSLVKEVEIENFSENSFSSKPIKIGGELDAYFKLVVGALN